jgi:hypothetical protein
MGLLHNMTMASSTVTVVPGRLGQQAKPALAGFVARMAVFACLVDIIYPRLSIRNLIAPA